MAAWHAAHVSPPKSPSVKPPPPQPIQQFLFGHSVDGNKKEVVEGATEVVDGTTDVVDGGGSAHLSGVGIGLQCNDKHSESLIHSVPLGRSLFGSVVVEGTEVVVGVTSLHIRLTV